MSSSVFIHLKTDLFVYSSILQFCSAHTLQEVYIDLFGGYFQD